MGPETEGLVRQIADQRGTLEDLEQKYIVQVLQCTGGHQGRAAKILGIDRKTLYNKIMKYGLGRTLGKPDGDLAGSGKTPVREERAQGA